jgi:hypothetical protein
VITASNIRWTLRFSRAFGSLASRQVVTRDHRGAEGEGAMTRTILIHHRNRSRRARRRPLRARRVRARRRARHAADAPDAVKSLSTRTSGRQCRSDGRCTTTANAAQAKPWHGRCRRVLLRDERATMPAPRRHPRSGMPLRRTSRAVAAMNASDNGDATQASWRCSFAVTDHGEAAQAMLSHHGRPVASVPGRSRTRAWSSNWSQLAIGFGVGMLLRPRGSASEVTRPADSRH